MVINLQNRTRQQTITATPQRRQIYSCGECDVDYMVSKRCLMRELANQNRWHVDSFTANSKNFKKSV